MSKNFDANGTDIDAYPDRAFKGGVYNGGVLGGYKVPFNPISSLYKAGYHKDPRGHCSGEINLVNGKIVKCECKCHEE